MKVTFLHHSSFLVELEHTYLLFDYFAGSRVNGFHFTGTIPKLASGKELYVFASHKHHDHFDMDTLKLADQYPNVHFIFSKDCKMSRNFLKKHGYPDLITEKITYTAPEKKYEVGSIKVRTLTSTDAGVAFSVTAEDQQIYHAGDLNWWHWEGEEELFNQYQEKTYKRQIDKLKGRRIDLAFVVVDQRLSQAVFWGLDYFMEHVDAGLVVPMHLWQDYSLIAACKEREAAAGFRERIFDVKGENQVFEL